LSYRADRFPPVLPHPILDATSGAGTPSDSPGPSGSTVRRGASNPLCLHTACGGRAHNPSFGAARYASRPIRLVLGGPMCSRPRLPYKKNTTPLLAEVSSPQRAFSGRILTGLRTAAPRCGRPLPRPPGRTPGRPASR